MIITMSKIKNTKEQCQATLKNSRKFFLKMKLPIAAELRGITIKMNDVIKFTNIAFILLLLAFSIFPSSAQQLHHHRPQAPTATPTSNPTPLPSATPIQTPTPVNKLTPIFEDHFQGTSINKNAWTNLYDGPAWLPSGKAGSYYRPSNVIVNNGLHLKVARENYNGLSLSLIHI